MFVYVYDTLFFPACQREVTPIANRDSDKGCLLACASVVVEQASDNQAIKKLPFGGRQFFYDSLQSM